MKMAMLKIVLENENGAEVVVTVVMNFFPLMLSSFAVYKSLLSMRLRGELSVVVWSSKAEAQERRLYGSAK